jgi:Zn-dependent M28 family amino/carboxypeptidase
MVTRLRCGLFVAALFALVALPARADAQSRACDTRPNNSHDKLQECVTLDGVREHMTALQAIADASHGHRTSGSPGFDRTLEYAYKVLVAAGYHVAVQPFQFGTFVELERTALQVVAPLALTVPNNVVQYSASGDVTAALTALRPLALDATPGCEAADFSSFPAGQIAAISRGGCDFDVKAANASAAGAVGVVFYNSEPGVLYASLGSGFAPTLPVTSVTQDIGALMVATPGLTMRLRTRTVRGVVTTYNLFAETTTGDRDNVVMAGAHADSVNAGAGMHDNGASVAALLEVAQQMSRVRTRNLVRFAFWGAEEAGSIGSSHYVNSLSPLERQRIALYLNFDMIASPNAVLFVYDGDDSDAVGAGAGPAGSPQIERLFAGFYQQRGLQSRGTDFTGRSDYAPFIAAGIAAGGIFTGADGIKSAAEVAFWGGTAGVPYDRCYHEACDTVANVHTLALDLNADAIAYGVLQYAMSTFDINGRRGQGNFTKVGPFPEKGPARR